MEIWEPSDQFKLAWAILKGDKVSKILGALDMEAGGNWPGPLSPRPK